MPSNETKKRQSKVRDEIRAASLITRLDKIANGKTMNKEQLSKALQVIEEEGGSIREMLEKAFQLGAEESTDPVRIRAAQVALPYLRPQLQAIEQTLVDPRDKADPAALLAQIRALLSAHPDLVRSLNEEEPSNGVVTIQ